MKLSFRLRIALLSTLISGAVLVGFGLWTWQAVQRANIRRIDQTIRDLGDRYLQMARGPQYWDRVNESLQFVFGEADSEAFVLLVRGRNGEVVHASVNWPPDWDAASVPTPAEAGFPEPPPPGRPRGPGFGRGLGPLPHGGRGGGAGRMGGMGPPPLLPTSALSFYTARSDGETFRVGVMSNPEATLALGLNLAPSFAEMVRLRRLFGLALPAALLLVALGGWWLAQRALRPVRALSRTAEGITVKGLDQRLQPFGDDQEFDRLIRVFNGMLDRLEKSFQQAVRFSADAAHELKTPLTILQGELASAVQAAPPGSQQQQTLNRLLEEVQRLKTITRKLLLLSLADAGRLKPQAEPVNLAEIVQAAAEDAEVLGENLRLQLDVQQPAWVKGDSDLLRQVVQNLTTNAVKFNQPGGTIAIHLVNRNGLVSLAVSNSGPGIPPEDRRRVFERFYRVEKSRSRRVDGAGLGLSLAREIARAHGGELTLTETTPGLTTFLLNLPAAERPVSPSGS